MAKITNILETNKRIIENYKNHKKKCETHESYESLRHPHKNHQNNINRKHQCDNHTIYKKFSEKIYGNNIG